MDDSSFLLIWLFFGVIFGFVCMAIWSQKGGNAFSGFLVGLLLGIIGLIIVAVANPNPKSAREPVTRQCPYCRSQIPPDATVCRFCQRESAPWRWVENAWVARNEQGDDWWLDPGVKSWFRVRYAPSCPYCGAAMAPNDSVCASCKHKSSRLQPSTPGS